MMNDKNIGKRLEEIINNEKIYERFAIEGDLLIALSNVVINNFKLYLWGMVKDIDYFIKFFRWYGLNTEGIIDTDEKKQGQIIEGIPVISPKDFISSGGGSDRVYVFVLTNYFKGIAKNRFIEVFRKRQCDFYHFTEDDITRILGCTYDWVDRERTDYYKKHKNEIIKFVQKLDIESQETLCAYIESYMNRDIYKGSAIASKYKYFYGSNREELYTPLTDNEVWLNCGASVGDTVYAYLMNGLQGKIYAVEGDNRTYSFLCQNVDGLPERLRNRIVCHNTYIDSQTDLHSMFLNEKLSLINADIEGSELNLLKCLKEKILSDRPVLAICIYHLKEDIVDIPRFCKENFIDYKYCVRKYTAWQHNIM